jgi:hypothetical protein
MRRLLAALLLVCATAHAHVGAADVFYEGEAGPYRLFVTVQPPEVIPGVANVQIRQAGILAGQSPSRSTSARSARLADGARPGVSRLRVMPLPLTGEAANRPPTPDELRRSDEDPQLFTGALWLMEAGSWQVRVLVDGDAGADTLAVPVAALPKRTRPMQRGLAILLAALLALLALGAVSIVGAAARESTLAPGDAPGRAHRRRAQVAMAAAVLAVAGVLAFGNAWWSDEARAYAGYTYKPLALEPRLDGGALVLVVRDPGWLDRRVDDWVPDHGHLVHLFVVSSSLDRIWHLHPTATGPATFTQALPSMPAGRYRLFADLVHRSGLAETATGELELPSIEGAPLSGDDAAMVEPVDGARIVWDREELVAGRATTFRFHVEDAAGRPLAELEPYMGMLGHAAFIKCDFSVFAHVHPSGSIPMASLAVARGTVDDPHAGHHPDATASSVSFPFGLPSEGDYRIFVQLKRHGRVETAAFDAKVQSSTSSR